MAHHVMAHQACLRGPTGCRVALRAPGVGCLRVEEPGLDLLARDDPVRVRVDGVPGQRELREQAREEVHEARGPARKASSRQRAPFIGALYNI